VEDIMAKLTINEALATQKVLRTRHAELVALRDANSHKETRFYGSNADKERVTEPTYDVKKLDKLITRVAAETRKLDVAIKAANAATLVPVYEWDENVLGQVE
jgi:hypothetical protein